MLDDEEATDSKPPPEPASKTLAMPALYLAGIVVGEVATRAGSPALGVTLYAIVLISGLNQATGTIGPDRALLLAVAVVALERLLGITMNLVPVGGTFRLILVAGPTAAAIYLGARRARYTLPDLGLVVSTRIAIASLLVVPPGLVIGVMYYDVVRPVSFFTDQGPGDTLGPIAVVALTTGLLEELLFRGLLQQTVTRRVGRRLGIGAVAALYALLAVTPMSAIGFVTVFLVALWLARLTTATGSILPAAAAHIGLNIGLALLAPLVR